MPGHFVISLDFELYWGVRDHRTLENYGENILGVRNAIPGMLALFKQYGIQATFSTVGLLFFENKKDLLAALPSVHPSYINTALSPYGKPIEQIGENESLDKMHFGASLIRQIQNSKNQEIGTHTFSHYYCLEEGQTPAQFDADLRAAQNVAQQWSLQMKSIVFPRNQYNPEYLSICKKNGITVYRGNESHWLYTPRKRGDESLIRRMLRLIDSYINISGHHIFETPKADSEGMINVPASRFLRPWSKKLSFLEGLRKKRILNSMTAAAKEGKVFHLWWHPHNFGKNTVENLNFLEDILKHYQKLNVEYGLLSSTMKEFSGQ